MSIFRRSKDEVERLNETNAFYEYSVFQPGEQFPPENSIERLSKYYRMKKLYDGKAGEIYERASQILKDTPHAKSLRQLYIAVNIADLVVTKAADLLVGEPPKFESGFEDGSKEQDQLDRYVEENDLIKLIHESCIGSGVRGDAWLKARYGYRQDFSALTERGLPEPTNVLMEPIVEHVAADTVFPETSRGNIKSFKAVNIASIEYVVTQKTEIPFLNLERHLPGYIIYERYSLHERELGIDVSYGYPVQVYKIGDRVSTGRDEDVVATGVPHLLVQHVPYKSVDNDWQGAGTLEKMETVLTAINDRLVQIDYILWKHSDPNAYGPPLMESGDGQSVKFGGIYIPVNKDEVAPGYMTWDGHLDAAFRELEILVTMAFQIAETPQWLLGSVLGSNVGGTGTSHTDSASVKARFMPITSKVNRIRTHYDRAVRDILWTCSLLDKQHGDGDFSEVYPSITWQDGIPKNELEQAEIMQIRTGGKATIDVQTAIEQLDSVGGQDAKVIMDRIESDDERVNSFVDGSVFNEEEPTQ